MGKCNSVGRLMRLLNEEAFAGDAARDVDCLRFRNVLKFHVSK